MNDPAVYVAVLALIGTLATAVALSYQAVQSRRARQDRSPADENEATRIGNDFFKSLLSEAREERKELRETIAALERDGNVKRERIEALEALDRKKTHRIEVLERRAQKAAEKLAAGVLLTVADLLGADETFIRTGAIDLPIQGEITQVG
jgi:hypothetical protein